MQLDHSAAEKRMVKKVICGTGEMDTDQESVGSISSEEMESPRSVVVAKVGRKNGWTTYGTIGKNTRGGVVGVGICRYNLHSQILKIRDEDSHIGEDVAEVLNNYKEVVSHVTLLSRPLILPASPLSGRSTAINAAHWEA